MKYVKFIIFSILVLFMVTINVNAKEKMDLVEVGITNGTKEFNNLSYNGYSIYQSNGVYFFRSTITNKTKKYLPISVNILLFNSDKKNIGIFNYCSKHDIQGDFSFKEIEPNGSLTFQYEIVNKYLADTSKYKLSDITYYAIQDDNKNCKVGGYNNYEGKTFDELNTEKEVEYNHNKILVLGGKEYDITFIKDKAFLIISISIVVIIFIYIIQGVIINALHIKLYKKSSALCYFPIANIYMACKVVFGSVAALIYFIAYIIGGVFVGLGLTFVSYILSLSYGIIFLLIIIKLISKQYELFLLTPINSGDKVFNNKKNAVAEEQQIKNDKESNVYGFNQHDSDKESMKNNMSLNEEEKTNNKINEDEESDLKKFFR